ncbi:MAG: deoxyribose-phosphate aldolase [Limnochordia bacterium]
MSEERWKEFAGKIDISLLDPRMTAEDVREFCTKALDYHFASVVVPTAFLEVAKGVLKDRMKLGSAISFPMGYSSTEVKVFETKDAIAKGADEIDFVMNIGAVRAGDVDTARRDMAAVVEAAQGRVTKVILETSLLTREEKILAAKIAVEAGVDFVKTCTGRGVYGATVDDIKLLVEAVDGKAQVKASQGIFRLKDALALLEAGATRLGTNAGFALVDEMLGQDRDPKLSFSYFRF